MTGEFSTNPPVHTPDIKSIKDNPYWCRKQNTSNPLRSWFFIFSVLHINKYYESWSFCLFAYEMSFYEYIGALLTSISALASQIKIYKWNTNAIYVQSRHVIDNVFLWRAMNYRSINNRILSSTYIDIYCRILLLTQIPISYFLANIFTESFFTELLVIQI